MTTHENDVCVTIDNDWCHCQYALVLNAERTHMIEAWPSADGKSVALCSWRYVFKEREDNGFTWGPPSGERVWFGSLGGFARKARFDFPERGYRHVEVIMVSGRAFELGITAIAHCETCGMDTEWPVQRCGRCIDGTVPRLGT